MTGSLSNSPFHHAYVRNSFFGVIFIEQPSLCLHIVQILFIAGIEGYPGVLVLLYVPRQALGNQRCAATQMGLLK